MSIATEALGYEAVRLHLMNETSFLKPLSIHSMFKKIESSVRNETQVRDAIRKYFDQGIVSRVRDDKGFVYWWRDNSDKTEPFFAEVKKPELTMKIPASTVVKPTVTVTKDKIIVEHPACRVVIDLF